MSGPRTLVLPSRLDTPDQVDELLEVWPPDELSTHAVLRAGELRRLSRTGARVLLERLASRGVTELALLRALPEASAQLSVAAAVTGVRLVAPALDLTPRSKRPSPRRRR